MDMLNHLNTVGSCLEIKVGDVLVIRRKQCKRDIVVQCKAKTDREIILSFAKNDYFNFDMYLDGSSWVFRVWNLGPLMLTAITNNLTEFPR